MAKRIFLSAVFLFASGLVSLPLPARSDVPAPPNREEEDIATLAYSLEDIASLEKRCRYQPSISLWGGAGSVWNSLNSERAWGGEIALEIRSYTSEFLYGNSRTGFNVGAYMGLFNSTDGGAYWILAPGLKLTGCIKIPDSPMIFEPYLSVSYPYTREDRGAAGWKSRHEPLLTFGLRMVFRRLY
jgi:hypothetical protein